jgi:hypothetical protein
VHDFFTLPYFYRSDAQDFFLQLTKKSELLFFRRCQREVWEQGEIIAAGCRRFHAAPDSEGMLHIFAADYDNNLALMLASGENIHKTSFMVKNSELPFLSAFSANGDGCFFGGQSGRLLHGAYSASGGWVVNNFSTAPEAATPTGLVMDRQGGSHLLLHDRARHTLLYQHSSQALGAGNPLTLAQALGSGALSVIWLDTNQTVHVAWYDSGADLISYCRKKAGGWPHGGWQPLQLLPVDFTPQYLGFFWQEQSVHLWVAGESGRLQVCSTPDSQLLPVGKDISGWQPLRIGALGINTLNFTASLPPESWCFPLETAADVNPAGESATDEQGQLLLLHARQLMEGRKLLEARLQKKEASLLQLRQLLERAQESHDRQRQKWQEQIRHLEGTVQKLTEKLNTDASVLPPLQAQCEQLQSRLTQTETEKRKLQAEVFSLRSKLGEAQITASQLREKVKQLESDLESRKSVWEKVAGLLHKKPSGKD